MSARCSNTLKVELSCSSRYEIEKCCQWQSPCSNWIFWELLPLSPDKKGDRWEGDEEKNKLFIGVFWLRRTNGEYLTWIGILSAMHLTSSPMFFNENFLDNLCWSLYPRHSPAKPWEANPTLATDGLFPSGFGGSSAAFYTFFEYSLNLTSEFLMSSTTCVALSTAPIPNPVSLGSSLLFFWSIRFFSTPFSFFSLLAIEHNGVSRRISMAMPIGISSTTKSWVHSTGEWIIEFRLLPFSWQTSYWLWESLIRNVANSANQSFVANSDEKSCNCWVSSVSICSLGYRRWWLASVNSSFYLLTFSLRFNSIAPSI